MKTKEGFNLRQVGNEYIIIAEGAENVDFTNIISFNETAARLWKEVAGKEFSAVQLTTLLLEWYDIDEKTATGDVASLLRAWNEAGIIEE